MTFLFTDVEGSTKLLHELGSERYAEALSEHRRILREAFQRHAGVEVDTQGDAFFVAFPTAPSALAAAREAQDELGLPVRMGIHTGTPLVTTEGYVGADVHRAARIAAAGHGGQVLVSATTASLADAELLDIGEHRLKDLSAAERIFQLGKEIFPPLKTLYRTNLPVPATPFLGRERELATVLDLIGQTGLLTLTGPGGTGKTRLAIQAAAEASESFPDGVFWVPLAPLRDPRLVLGQVGQAVGAKDDAADHVGDKHLLLVLDNFEHLIEAVDDLVGLQAYCPNLRLLVTSREILRLPGEQAYPVPPLEPQEGAELFVSRARAADPAFAAGPAVPELCAKLDNLPLALELAAARVRMLSPEQLLERLSKRLDFLKAGRGVDPRQQTLRATIEWSHELLSEDEQCLFARLAVFHGGWTLEAAEEVCEAELDTLESLVDKSLVRFRDSDRFWMLETIREFAVERLEESGEADKVRRRHAEHFLALSEEAEEHLFTASSGEWHEQLERELDNLRAALDRLEAKRETELALRMAGALGEFWSVKGHLAEGRRRIERGLQAYTRPTSVRAKALNAGADLANGSGDSATARRLAEEGLALNRALGREWATADSLLILGIALVPDFAAARELWEGAASAYRDLGDRRNALEATRFLAWAHGELGDGERAVELLEEGVREARELGDRLLEGRFLDRLAGHALGENRPADAVQLLKEAFDSNKSSGDTYWRPFIVFRFAQALSAADKPDAAARLLASAAALGDEIGSAAWLADENVETRDAVRARLGEAAYVAASEEGSRLTADDAVALALSELGHPPQRLDAHGPDLDRRGSNADSAGS